MSNSIGWQFDNSYACLPEFLYARTHPVPVRAPNVAILNHALAESLGLDLRTLSEEQAALLFAGNGCLTRHSLLRKPMRDISLVTLQCWVMGERYCLVNI